MKTKFPLALLLIINYQLSIINSFSQTIVGGGLHSLSLCKDSTVMAWGYNINGQLGVGDTTDRWSPQQVHGPGNVGFLTGISVVASGGNPLEGVSHSLALKNDGSVWAWGRNSNGQLGVGDTISSLTPVQVHGVGNVGFLQNITTIAGGGYHTLAIKNDSTVWAWGRNNHGQLGVGDTNSRTTPVQVNALTGITAISCGWGNSLALKKDGTVWSWGQNYLGQLGVGDTTDRHAPVQVSGLTGITAIAAGGGHCLALKNDSTVWAWGYNAFGQLGDSTGIDKQSPVQISSFTSIIAVSVGAGHSLALKNDGTVWAWGFNQLNQLGDSTTLNRNYPVKVSLLTGVSAISGGGAHCLALKNDGTVWAWGYNATGQLGDGTDTTRSSPVKVNGLCFVNGISQIENLNSEILIYPNPSADGKFQILIPIAIGTKFQVSSIEIINVLGEKVYSSVVSSQSSVVQQQTTNNGQLTTNIDLNEANNGIYFLQVKTSEGIANKKIVISR